MEIIAFDGHVYGTHTLVSLCVRACMCMRTPIAHSR